MNGCDHFFPSPELQALGGKKAIKYICFILTPRHSTGVDKAMKGRDGELEGSVCAL